MSGLHVYGSARIDSGEVLSATLSVWRDVHILRTLADKPNPKWRALDAHGHMHGFSSTGERYPTLAWHWIDLPTEDGAGHGEYRCRACSDPVSPGMLPGPTETPVAGPADWSITLRLLPGEALVNTVPELLSWCTVWFTQNERTDFGLARVTEVHADDQGVSVVLQGSGELGRAVR